MSRKSPQPAAPLGARVQDPDRYYVFQFLLGAYDLLNKRNELLTDAKLAGLAKVSDDQLFYLGINYALRTAHREAPLLSEPVYRNQFIQQFEEVGRAAHHLHRLLKALVDPRDHTSLWVGRALGYSVNRVMELSGELNEEDTLRRIRPLKPFLAPLSTLEQASTKATFWADNFDIKAKGKPRGIKDCGMALIRFVRSRPGSAS